MLKSTKTFDILFHESLTKQYQEIYNTWNRPLILSNSVDFTSVRKSREDR
jgi:hypothetical protein